MKSGTRRALCATLLILVFGSAGALPSASKEFSNAEKTEIEKIVRDYIRENPEVIGDYLRQNPEILLEVADILRARQARQEREGQKLALEAHREAIERHPMTPVTGNAKGDVTVVEFFDYNCPYCKQVYSYLRELEKEDTSLRLAWKEFPILGPVSVYAARAAMAADRQGRYMDMHHAMMNSGRLVSEEQVLKIAAAIGLDVDRLQKDMKDPEVEAYLKETIQLANALGITGTPGFVVGDEIVAGAIEKEGMMSLIQRVRRGGS